MKKIYLLSVLFVSLLTSFAPADGHIKKAYAYYTITLPGIQMSDENGNPVPQVFNITRFIYIEWSGAMIPVIESVWYNNIPLPATLIAANSNTVITGNKFEDNREIKITCNKRNSLWKIELHPASGNRSIKEGCKNIVIKIKGKNKIYHFKLQKETQLMTLPRY